VGKEARSLDNLFTFRESEKSLKKTPGGVPFSCIHMGPKRDKIYPTHSHVFKLENE
jgi:hypothetical protein